MLTAPVRLDNLEQRSGCGHSGWTGCWRIETSSRWRRISTPTFPRT